MLKPFNAPGKLFFGRSLFARVLRRSGAESADSEVVFDLSRLLSRSYHTTPTGIDRVEMAYACALIDRLGERLQFAAVHPAGGYYGRLQLGAVRQFLALTLARWEHPNALGSAETRRISLRHLLALRPRPVPAPQRPRIYLQASPHHLEDTPLVARILKLERARFVTLVHDVIPITFPEYARPDGHARHAQRMQTIALHADGVIANSQATLDAVTPLLSAGRTNRVMRVAHLGWDYGHAPIAPRSATAGHPYFVTVGTIEPRKNHLMLLNVWRRLVARLGAATPRLVIVGRRGWENENVVDMLERCTVLRDHVVERSDTSDREMGALLQGARAALLPSFAEGFGMPVLEALVAGVPVICSDLPVLREVGGDVPDYIDPLDGLGWLRAVEDYADDGVSRRADQIARMAQWRPSSWAAHLDIVEDTIAQVAAAR